MPDDDIRHERRDFALRPVLSTLAGVAVLVVGAAGVLDFAYPHPAPVSPEPRRGDTPLLQVDPARDLAALKAAQLSERDRLGWTDRDAGLVHIPVSEAMRIIALRGLPDPGTPAECGPAARAVPRAPQPGCGEGGE